jgi:hypothetical protein
MSALVSVPVLSVAMTVAFPIVSQEHADKEVLLHHLVCHERKRKDDGKRETFGNGNDYQGDGDDENLNEVLTLAVRGPVKKRGQRKRVQQVVNGRRDHMTSRRPTSLGRS